MKKGNACKNDEFTCVFSYLFRTYLIVPIDVQIESTDDGIVQDGQSNEQHVDRSQNHQQVMKHIPHGSHAQYNDG